MTSPAKGSAQERINLLIDLPSKLNTALRTIRLYPPTNPQVQRNINQVLDVLKALLSTSGKSSIDIAISENKLLVDGEQLPEKEQGRPQVQGFVTILNTVSVHSLTFHDTITPEDCSKFVQILAKLNSAKDLTDPINTLLEQSRIKSIEVDMRRYVALHEGEQLTTEGIKGDAADALGQDKFDKDLLKTLLGDKSIEDLAHLTPDQIKEMIQALPQATLSHAHPARLEHVVSEALRQMTGPGMLDSIQAEDIDSTSMALAGLHPMLMARVIDDLPDTELADEMLVSTLQWMAPAQLDILFSELLARQARQESGEDIGEEETEKKSLFSRVVHLNQKNGGMIPGLGGGSFESDRIGDFGGASLLPDIGGNASLEDDEDEGPGKATALYPSLERYTDAYALLHGQGLGSGNLPEDILNRLQNPQWSASVLFTTVQQLANPANEGDQETALQSFNTLLASYESLFDRAQIKQVATQTAVMLTSLGDDGLENVLGNRLKGQLGSEIYNQIINKLSDDRLENVLTRQTPQQINRMAAALVGTLPLQPERDEDGEEIEAPLVHRLGKTSRGPEIKRSIALYQDAKVLLHENETPAGNLSHDLIERLKNPEWSASVVTAIAQQLADTPKGSEQEGIHVSFNHLLASYEQLLDRDQQSQLALQASLQMASMGGKTLSKILDHTFRGSFGAEVYRRIVEQLSDELMDETVNDLDTTQISRMIAGRIGDSPVRHLADPSHKNYIPENDPVLKRLVHTARGPEIAKNIAQTVDARIVEAPPEKVPVLPERVAMRLQQPAWSAPVLVKVAEHSVDPGNFSEEGKADMARYERALTRYDALLSKEKQTQVATQAGAEIADFSSRELSLILVQKYKSLFADQVYHQIVTGISEKKFKRLANDLHAVSEGRNELPLNIKKEEVKEAYGRMMQTIRTKKIEKIIAIQKTSKTLEERKRRKNIQDKLNQLLSGDLGGLKEEETIDILSESVQPLLEDQQRDTVENMLMQLAGALQHSDPVISTNAALVLIRITEQLAQTSQWQILIRLMPALHQVLLLQKDDPTNIHKVTDALAGLAAFYILQEDYVQAIETTSFFALPYHSGEQARPG